MKASLRFVLADRRTTSSSMRSPIQVNVKIDGRSAFDPQPTGFQCDEQRYVESLLSVGTIPTCELVFALNEGALSSPE